MVFQQANRRKISGTRFRQIADSLLARKPKEELPLKIMKGWRKIDNQRGFVNEKTGHNLVVTKKQFGEHYLVLLYSETNHEAEGRKISPEYVTEAKAAAFAMGWMAKHPNE